MSSSAAWSLSPRLNTHGRPIEVQIGPITWSISYDHAEFRRLQRVTEESGLMGYTLKTAAAIYVDAEGVSESLVRNTLLHEVLHALVWTYNITATASDTNEREEELVSRLDASLLALLRDNPELLAYLTETTTEEARR